MKLDASILDPDPDPLARRPTPRMRTRRALLLFQVLAGCLSWCRVAGLFALARYCYPTRSGWSATLLPALAIDEGKSQHQLDIIDLDDARS